jgi:hypothetical protein
MKINNLKTGLFGATIVGLLMLAGCKKDFGSLNTDPSVVTDPEIKFLLSFSEEAVAGAHTGEWVYEGFEQLLRFTQHVTLNAYDIEPSVNTRYGRYYTSILPNLYEIRSRIEAKEDKADYAKMTAVTHVLQVLFGIRVTDMNGSMPYSEAVKGRTEGIFNPKFDNQELLFETWLTELDASIGALSAADNAKTKSFGNSDIFYGSNWTKWIKLANTLKLRIAARYENQNSSKTASIAAQVASNPVGPMMEMADDMKYRSPLNNGVGGDINYRAAKFAGLEMMNFMKMVEDPRIAVYFSPNELVGAFRDTLSKYSVNLPSFIDLNDPMLQFQGAPADLTRDIDQADYLLQQFTVSPNNKYYLISAINRRFFSPRWQGDNTNARYTELLVGAAESCFMMAEFIEKGYASGSAQTWYNKGVTASMQTMNEIAIAANSTSMFSGAGTVEINDYLSNPDVALNGGNNLEKIYAQQHLSLIRQANEAYVFCRRTGFPSNNSSYFPREPFSDYIVRRLWIEDPGEVNRENWLDAYTQQGFTPRTRDKQKLSEERVWYDKTAPVFGGADFGPL